MNLPLPDPLIWQLFSRGTPQVVSRCRRHRPLISEL
jgi:hypothetical protein